MATDKKEDYMVYDCFDHFVFIKNKYAVVNDWNSVIETITQYTLYQSYGSTPAGLKVLDWGPVLIYINVVHHY